MSPVSRTPERSPAIVKTRIPRLFLVLALGALALATSSCQGYMSVSVPGPFYGSSVTVGGPIGHP